MANGVKYLILTIIFLGITKLLQVTSFDGEKYDALVKKRENRLPPLTSKKKSTKDNKVASTSELTLKKKSKEQDQKKVTPSKAGKSENPELESLLTNYLEPLLENLPPDGLRKDIFIRYYRHNKDGIGVYKLEEMGYYMHQKPATETAGLGSNTIYYGDDVPLEDIQIVALTLLREGIPLKSIKHTKFEWKSSAIEIGTDTSIVDMPNISIEEIMDFHKLYMGGSFN